MRIRHWKPAAALAMILAIPVIQSSPHAYTGPITPAGVAQITTTRAPMVPNRAVFLGDSYTVGVGGDGERWTTMLASHYKWDEINLGSGGTGYVKSLTGAPARYACGTSICPNYVDASRDVGARRPEIIFIAGGRNDFGTPESELDTNSRKLYRQLRTDAPRAKVYVISPMWSATPYPDWLERRAEILKQNADAEGITYLDIGSPLTGHPELIADGVHPTAKGYQVLSQAVISAYERGQ